MSLHSFEKEVPLPGRTITQAEFAKIFPRTAEAEEQLRLDLDAIRDAETRASIHGMTVVIGHMEKPSSTVHENN
jgi:hypothetical protein